jgi:hypothetical protein
LGEGKTHHQNSFLLTPKTLSDYNTISVAAEKALKRFGDTIAIGVSKSPSYPTVGENPRSRRARVQKVSVAIHAKIMAN